jgi:riboflavin synthase
MKKSMFTGIIEEVGVIRSLDRKGHSVALFVQADKVLKDMKAGDSINTNGVCLTVTSFTSDGFSSDVMPETYNRSGFSKIRIGERVNLERALRLGDRLGGHIVSGHIDGTGAVSRRWKDENAEWMTISADPGIMKYIVEKGSVALDGVSLTVVRIDVRSFDVSLVPFTQQETILHDKRAGNLVNIECDVVGKYIERLYVKEKGTITAEFLQQMGF